MKFIKTKSKDEDYPGNANSLLNQNHSIFNGWITFELNINYSQISITPPISHVTDMFKDHTNKIIKLLSKLKLKFI